MTTLAALVAAAGAPTLAAGAAAQTGVPLPYPSPLDAMRGDSPPRVGARSLPMRDWQGREAPKTLA